MTKEQLVAHIDNLLKDCQVVTDQADPFKPFNGALTLMRVLYGENSPQLKALVERRKEIYAKYTGYATTQELKASVAGALQNLRAEIEIGLLPSLEGRITSDVLSDFVTLAREALQELGEGPKNVAAVLAAAAYEDTLRRMAGGSREKLEAVIGGLKQSEKLVAPQVGIAQGFLSFRNHALHANWESIDRAAVESVLGFVQELLLHHFGGN
jgi:hypothetical protein